MKKVCAILLSVMLLLGCMTANVFAAGSVSLKVEASAGEVQAGDTVSFTVYLVGADSLPSGVWAYEFSLSLPAGLTFVSGSADVSNASALGFNMPAFNEGSMKCTSGMGALNQGFAGSKGAVLTFKCKASEDFAGSLWVGLTSTVIGDGLNAVSHDVIGTSVTVVAPHVHSYTSAVTPPTCTEKGYTTYTCQCGDSYVDNYVNATGHKGTKVGTTAPTCTEQGYTTYKCDVCGQSYRSDYVSAKGHSASKSGTTAATCTEGGYTTYKCSVCGYSYQADHVDALGHSYGKVSFKWADDYSACTASVRCTKCSHTITDECQVTSQTTPATTEAKGEIVYTATFMLDGQTYTDTKSVVLPKLEPEPGARPGISPVIYLILALVAAAGIGVLVFFYLKKKKENPEEQKAASEEKKESPENQE